MSVTEMLVAPSMTWLLVRTSPLEVRTIPVPAAEPPSSPSVVLMSTRSGETDEAIDETLAGEPAPVWFDPALPEPVLPVPPKGKPLPKGKLPEPLFPLDPLDPLFGVVVDGLVDPAGLFPSADWLAEVFCQTS